MRRQFRVKTGALQREGRWVNAGDTFEAEETDQDVDLLVKLGQLEVGGDAQAATTPQPKPPTPQPPQPAPTPSPPPTPQPPAAAESGEDRAAMTGVVEAAGTASATSSEPEELPPLPRRKGR